MRARARWGSTSVPLRRCTVTDWDHVLHALRDVAPPGVLGFMAAKLSSSRAGRGSNTGASVWTSIEAWLEYRAIDRAARRELRREKWIIKRSQRSRRPWRWRTDPSMSNAAAALTKINNARATTTVVTGGTGATEAEDACTEPDRRTSSDAAG